MDFLDKLTSMVRRGKLFNFYYNYLWKPTKSSIQSVIYEHASTIDDFYFIQIGANDGFTNDPIYKFIRTFNWKGVLIEPQKKVFENGLKKTYSGNDNLVLVNAAIDAECGTKELYKIGFSDSKWATGLSSMEKEMIHKQISRGYVAEKAKESGEQLPDSKEDFISTETVQTVTFEKLFSRLDIKKVDGLFIDAEGYDGEIMKLYDFENHTPGLVLFEHLHLTQKEEQEWIERFREMGFSIQRGKHNTLAYQTIN